MISRIAHFILKKGTFVKNDFVLNNVTSPDEVVTEESLTSLKTEKQPRPPVPTAAKNKSKNNQ